MSLLPTRATADSGLPLFALIGNPNCGKSTLFNALTGLRQKTGNYPGVTVEKKEGTFFGLHGEKFALIDLPGTYSLLPQSPDEQVTRDVLAGTLPGTRQPDAVICVVDSSNLSRNLYLAGQVLETGLPVILALNMMDRVKAMGHEIDCARLSEELGCPVIPCQADAKKGLVEIKSVLSGPLKKLSHSTPQTLAFARSDSPSERHALLQNLCASVLLRSQHLSRDRTAQIDRILTHRVWGWFFFLILMSAMFLSIFVFASGPMDLIDGLFNSLGAWLRQQISPGDLRDLLTDGVLPGVGGVLVFLPQILILYFFIGLLEDSGYMARAAFIMDHIMGKVGLCGKSFIPLLSSHACAIPGVMATRSIENSNDRLATILVAPFMSCSARLPVYSLMIAALFPRQTFSVWIQAAILMALYLLGAGSAFFFAFLFKKILFQGKPPHLLLELPPYHLPSPSNIALAMFERAKAFLIQAGTVILGLSILLWFFMAYPKSDDPAPGQQLSQSFAGQLGRAIEPLIAPLGFNWRIGIGLVGAQAAREVFVSTMAIVYNVTDDDETNSSLRERLQEDHWPDGRPVFTPLVCVAVMVFFALSMQCLPTLAVVKRETNSWRWPIFQFAYMGAWAYLVAFAVYQGGHALGW